MEINLAKIFRHCPKCGAKSPKAVSKKKHIICNECGFIYYHNVTSSAAAIIEYESKVLVITRANEPKAGMLDLPGGFAEYGESIEEALKREVREELGIIIKNPRYLTSQPNIYIYRGVEYRTIDVIFTCRITNPAVIKYDRDEVAGIRFFELAQIPLDKFAFESTKKGIEYYIKHKPKDGQF
jgi:NAD+ diphosphatase